MNLVNLEQLITERIEYHRLFEWLSLPEEPMRASCSCGLVVPSHPQHVGHEIVIAIMAMGEGIPPNEQQFDQPTITVGIVVETTDLFRLIQAIPSGIALSLEIGDLDA